MESFTMNRTSSRLLPITVMAFILVRVIGGVGDIPAMMVFGDSIVDPGNNNNLKTIVKCDFPPYGNDFEGRRATGRFSDGFVPSDFFAQMFGIKEQLPPYLDPNLQLEDLLTGVSFASGGCGYDPLTPKIVSVLSFSDQLDLFRKYIEKVKTAVGEEKMSTILSRSFFLICAGSDDIANTYYSTPLRRIQYNVSSYTDLMASSALTFLQELYGLGARKIGVLSVPPIGCVPSQRTTGGGLSRNCAEERNNAARVFNSKLESLMITMSAKLEPGTKLVYMDVYNPVVDIIANPSKYGFEEAAKGCCGTGTIEVSVLCNRYSLSLCTNASKYVFWDSYHPTQAAYKIIARMIFDKYSAEFR